MSCEQRNNRLKARLLGELGAVLSRLTRGTQTGELWYRHVCGNLPINRGGRIINLIYTFML